MLQGERGRDKPCPNRRPQVIAAREAVKRPGDKGVARPGYIHYGGNGHSGQHGGPALVREKDAPSPAREHDRGRAEGAQGCSGVLGRRRAPEEGDGFILIEEQEVKAREIGGQAHDLGRGDRVNGEQGQAARPPLRHEARQGFCRQVAVGENEDASFNRSLN
jgi:hypothetical protein